MKHLWSVVVTLSLLAGCQSTPSNQSSAIEFAESKYSVFMVSVDDNFEFEKGYFFRSSYAMQDKMTLSLPGVEGVFKDFINHCHVINGNPRFVDGITLVCSSDGKNLYAVNSFQGSRDAWVQVVEPKDKMLIDSAKMLSDYSRNNFMHYVGQDINSTYQLLGTSALRKNFPEYF
ncbi:TPA: hypothetical protein RUZ63_003530 [Vibrio cholerae]|nr:MULTISPECIES: hypothetical protein [Vibrio]EJV9424585.1 hypothetical protein [Vibrio vulnificus]EGQ9631924.1 hypothetical protein [Vibrio cholerae]EGQ9639216.1 hypothetical protein [Vibrio cholerae]EGR3866294.1 hypothetical protein [Vibrio cholerae]EGZ6883264.1 hypothetical protein [Vibrio cholerae]